MAYTFVSISEARSQLAVHGITVGQVFTNWITPLRKTSLRANLYYEAQEIGYIETNTDLQPDEQWVVNIPLHQRSLLPSGMLNAIFGDTVVNEGWENKQFYIETNMFQKVKFGENSEYQIEAKGPNTTLHIKSLAKSLKLTLRNTYIDEDYNVFSVPEYMAFDIDYSALAHQMRLYFSDIIDLIALEKYKPQDLDKTDGQTGYVLGIDNMLESKWMPIQNLNINYFKANYLEKNVGGTISQPISLTYAITDNKHAVTKEYVDNMITSKKRKFLIGDNVNTTYRLNHWLNNRDVIVFVYDNASYVEKQCTIKRTNVNYIDITFPSVINTDSVVVNIISI